MLVVEDDPRVSGALELLLSRRGWEVVSVTGVRPAMKALGDGFDWIVLDLMLPDGEGVQVLRTVREQNLDVRVVVTTGTSDPDRLDAVRALKPHALLQKPLTFAQLLDALNEE